MATRVYVGRVPYEARESDVERFFKGFGHLEHVLMKRGFCYVEFKDARDASDAIAELNGKSMLGDKVIVEQARSREDSRGGRRGGGGYDRYDDRDRRGGGGPPARRSGGSRRSRSRSPPPRRRERSRSRSSSGGDRKAPRRETRRSPSYDR